MTRLLTRRVVAETASQAMSERALASSRSHTSMSTQQPEHTFFKTIQSYVEEAGRVVDLPDHVAQILSQPKNEIIVHFPVRMGDGSTRLFKGYRIQHNNLLGPYKGGLRYHESVSLDDMK